MEWLSENWIFLLVLVAFVAVGAVAGAFLGSALAGRLPDVWIRRSFAAFLALMSVWLFATE